MAKRTKGAFTYRGHVVNFRTTEKDGRWQCSASFESRNTGFQMSALGPLSNPGFATKDVAELATVDMVKNWIDNNRPESPPASNPPHENTG